jgi:hypothetical protein
MLHVMQDLDPASEWVPAGQVLHGAMPESENMPAGQRGAQADAPAGDEKPASHLWQVLEPSLEYDPASQGSHVFWPRSLLKVPALQGVQVSGVLIPFLDQVPLRQSVDDGKDDEGDGVKKTGGNGAEVEKGEGKKDVGGVKDEADNGNEDIGDKDDCEETEDEDEDEKLTADFLQSITDIEPETDSESLGHCLQDASDVPPVESL